MKWERIDDTQITVIEGDYKQGFVIEVLSLGGTLLNGPRGISNYVAERCMNDYEFVPIRT